MKMRKTISLILTLVMLFGVFPISLAPTVGADAPVTFSVSVSGNTFTVTRSATGTAQRVYYRTVGLSAIDGVHFTGVRGLTE